MNAGYSTLNVGDLLTRTKALGLFDHAGVYVAPNAVLQNTPEKGEHLTTLGEFSSGKPIMVQHTGVDPVLVQQRARKILAAPKRYDAFFHNCYDTASEVIRGVSGSPKLIATILFAGCLVLICLALRKR